MEALPPSTTGALEGDVGRLLWGGAAELARRVTDRLEGWRPDVVVADTLVPAGGLAAQLLDVPWVELIPHHLTDPAPDLPPVGLGRRLARSSLRRADDRHIYRAQMRSVALGDSQALAAARDLALGTVAPPSLRLVATLPGLERHRAEWPPTAHVVGPLAVDPALPELDPPPGDEPLVVVTDSTAATAARSIGEVAARALIDLPVRVAITSASLPASARDRMVIGRGPHGPLLRQAALAVGPGGGGFVSKSLAAGVPLVVVPLAGDQREAAARLRDARAGRSLSPRRLGAFSLRWAVLRHLADRPASRAAVRLGDQAASLGPGLAARLVSEVAAGHAPVASGPGHHLDSTTDSATGDQR